MKKQSYHTHTTISDGKLSPRELIELAISKSFKLLGITDHYPRPLDVDPEGWSSGFYTDEDYNELRKLQEEYKDKIDILVGAEFEWYDAKRDWLFGEINQRDYDLKVISAHKICVEGDYCPLNYDEDAFENVLKTLGGDIKKIVNIYYETLRKAIGSGWFDLVAHLDLIKTYNSNSKFFSEEESWYRAEVLETLDIIKYQRLKMEINLAGLARPCKEQWPSKWILDNAREREIPLVVSTDAHNESELDYNPQDITRLLA